MQFSRLAAFSALAASVLAQGDLAAVLQSQPDLSTLLQFVSLVGLNETLSTASNITIFAPTNSAFTALSPDSPEAQAVAANDTAAITALLQNHVVQGAYNSSAIGNVPTFVRCLLAPSTNGSTSYTGIIGGSYNGVVKNGDGVDVISGGLTVAKVTQADIPFGSGVVIHKIDTILSLPPSFLEFTARAGYTAINAALTAAEVDLPLGAPPANGNSSSNATDYTIFIPNNAAFQDIASVLSSANTSVLQQVLSYHVIAGSVIFSTQLGNITAPSALPNGNLTFTVAGDGSAWVNNAKIVQPNIIFYNGVAHVIDSVLNPLVPFNRSSDLTPSAPAASRVAFAGASSASSLPFSSVSFSQVASYTSTAAILTTAPAINTAAVSSNTALPSSSASYTGAAAPTNGVSGLLKTGAAVAAAAGMFAVGI